MYLIAVIQGPAGIIVVPVSYGITRIEGGYEGRVLSLKVCQCVSVCVCVLVCVLVCVWCVSVCLCVLV